LGGVNSDSGDDSDSNVVPFPDRCDDDYCDKLAKQIVDSMAALTRITGPTYLRAAINGINSLIDDYNRLCGGDLDHLDPDDYIGLESID
jgi:hypothetical protein